MIRNNRSFSLLWYSSIVNEFGNKTSIMAMPLIGLLLFQSNVMETAMVTVLQFLPNLIFSHSAGAFVERVNKKTLLVVSNILAAALSLCFFLGVYYRIVNIYLFYGYIFIMSTQSIYTGIAFSSLIKLMVSKESYVDATSQFTITNNINRVIGPSVGAIVVDSLGVLFATLLDAISFLSAALLQLGIRNCEPFRYKAKSRSVKSLGSTVIQYILRHPLFSKLYISSLLVIMGVGIFQSIQIYFIVEVLDVSASVMGILFTIANLGMIGSSFLGKRCIYRFGAYKIICLYYTTLLLGVGIFLWLSLVPVQSSSLLVGVLLLSQVAMLILNPMYGIAVATIRLKEIDKSIYPRVIAFWGFFTRGGVAIASLLSAMIIGTVGFTSMYVLVILLIFVALICIISNNNLKEYGGLKDES